MDIKSKPEDAQCKECSVDQPYDEEIMAGGVLCGGCGRTRPNTKYILASQFKSGERREQKEEVEAAAEKFANAPHYSNGSKYSASPIMYLKKGFIAGAKWAESQRQDKEWVSLLLKYAYVIDELCQIDEARKLAYERIGIQHDRLIVELREKYPELALPHPPKSKEV